MNDGEYNVAKVIQEALVKRGDRRKEWGFQSELDLDQWILTKVPTTYVSSIREEKKQKFTLYPTVSAWIFYN